LAKRCHPTGRFRRKIRTDFPISGKIQRKGIWQRDAIQQVDSDESPKWFPHFEQDSTKGIWQRDPIQQVDLDEKSELVSPFRARFNEKTFGKEIPSNRSI
jgi:hypothetical protein